MPRALPNSPNSIRKKKDATIRQDYYNARGERKIRAYEAAAAMKISAPTLIAKIENPEEMTIAQFRALRDLIGITDEELLEMI